MGSLPVHAPRLQAGRRGAHLRRARLALPAPLPQRRPHHARRAPGRRGGPVRARGDRRRGRRRGASEAGLPPPGRSCCTSGGSCAEKGVEVLLRAWRRLDMPGSDARAGRRRAAARRGRAGRALPGPRAARAPAGRVRGRRRGRRAVARDAPLPRALGPRVQRGDARGHARDRLVGGRRRRRRSGRARRDRPGRARRRRQGPRDARCGCCSTTRRCTTGSAGSAATLVASYTYEAAADAFGEALRAIGAVRARR